MALTLTNAQIIISSPLSLADYTAKADSGTTTTLVSRELKDLDAETTIGSYICFLSNGNRGVDRIITDYTTTGGVGTFHFDALPEAVTNASIFSLLSVSYIPASDRASEIISNDLRKKGYDLDNFLTPAHLYELHINKTVSHICQAKMQDADTDDTYYVNYQIFEERYGDEFNTLIADYDTDEDGTIESGEDNQNIGQVVLGK